MIVIGLTGGIASGKSYVARLFADHGAAVLDADRHAHDALGDPQIVAELVRRWGPTVIDENGLVCRAEIARRVFGDDPSTIEERRFLEGLVHPWVRRRLETELDEAKQAGAPAAVLDIPLLFEAGWADRCDQIVFVDTPAAIRTRRCVARGWGPDDLRRRESSQTPIAEKRRRADATVPGDDAAAAAAAVAHLSRGWVRRDG